MNSKKSEEQIRLEKLQTLRDQKVEPYPSTARRESTVLEARNQEGRKVWIAGKLVSIRDHGKSKFGDLQDETGKIQLYFKSDILGKEKYDSLALFDVGDYLEIYGEIFKTHMGEITVRVKNYKLLAKSLLPLPDQWYGFKDIESRYRKRFVDLLINKDVKKNLEIKSKVVSYLRNFMHKNGFVEVETPTLQSIPGGAAAKPFVTHYNILDTDFYLRISPELYLKRLVVGGFEKVFEIGKVFRNEGLSHMHNPEFTIFEFYWAYKDYNFLMDFTEKLISKTVKEIKGTSKIDFQGNKINFNPPYRKVSLVDLIKEDSGINITRLRNFKKLKEEIKRKNIQLDLAEIKTWTKLVDELWKKVSRPKIVRPTFVLNHPIELSPLAKERDDDKKTAQRFQLVCGEGFEIVNAYSELNDPIDQEERMKQQLEYRKAGWEEGERLDANYIEALKYGMPPTAGWGMGIDRFVMLLTDQYSIKEVIPFPTLRPPKNDTPPRKGELEQGQV